MATLYRARTVHTMDPSVRGNTIAVDAGRITAVGEWSTLRATEPLADVIDLGDATIVPGLIDSHIHALGGIQMTRGADLRFCRTIDEIEQALRAHLALNGGEWLLGWGADPNAFGDNPSGALMDWIAPGMPASLMLFDAHSIVASRTAWERAGLRGDETFSDASVVATDAAGSPTGYLIERGAMNRVLELIPQMSLPERAASLYNNLWAMAQTGFTGAHSLDLDGDDFEELLGMVDDKRGLPLRLTISPILSPSTLDDDIDRVIALQGKSGGRWRISGVKLFIDGTVDNGTAWLSSPDARGESTRSQWMDPSQYDYAVRRLSAANVPTRTHAIGDKGIDYVARTLAELPPHSVKHRIEHLEIVTDETLDVLARSGIAASMQPTHCTEFVRADGSDNWSERLGTDRAALGWRTRDVRDRGITLALGSDWPVAVSDARKIIADAQLRRPAGSQGFPPIDALQALTAFEALEGLTTHAAASIGATSPALIPGASASFTVFGRDPLTTDADLFAQTDVILTAVNGEHVVTPPDAGSHLSV